LATLVESPYRCTFIHIPKTGGNTITAWLKKNFNTHVTKGKQHATLPQAQQIYQKDTGFTYCVVRNPWDYCVSWYTFKIYLCEAYIREVEADPQLENTKDRYNVAKQQATLQRLKEEGFEHWLKTFSRKQQWNWAKDCDHVMKLENLIHDFKVVQEKLNCYVPLGHINKTPNRIKNYRDYYTEQDSIDYVSQQYRQDIEQFNYAF